MTTCWRLANDRRLTLNQPRLLAIVNRTPDSFSDGGQLESLDAAVAFCHQALADGADGLDIGGESTRPGAQRVEASEQVRRIVPVIEQLRASGCNCPISADTTSAKVAQAALDAGADAINDVSAALDDDAMLPLLVRRGAGMVLMHRWSAPASDSYSDQYESEPRYDPARGGVVGCVRAFLRERAQAAIEAGAPPQCIVLDPGLGFGKSVKQNYELIRRADELLSLGFPLLSGASRKSFIGAASGVQTPGARVAGSVAVSVAQYLAGVRLFRTHDVASHVQALRVAQHIATS